MTGTLDLDAYFGRIGFDAPAPPTLATLQRLHTLQPATIPFENLDPLLGRPVRLDLDALQAKLVGARRGGYCFELNALFAAALEALGFAVTRLAARVRWMRPPEQETARSHMLLRVDLEQGAYLADAGFGGYLFPAPVRLEREVEQPNSHGTVRLVGDEPFWILQALLPGGWQDCYRFTLEPALPQDYAVSNWFTATHPESPFTNVLMVQRLAPERRLSLLNTRLTARHRDGTAEERTLASAAELQEVLSGLFAIDPPSPVVDVWSRLPSG